MFQYGNQNRDHPKAFFGKWKHNVALVFNDDFGNDCLGAIIEKKDYHSDDYAYYAADNLLTDTTVPGKLFLTHRRNGCEGFVLTK
jgi:hypothetical protein